jgi:activator of HSP90 ATPase
MPKTIKQTVTFNAEPREIFDMLMDSKKHSIFTGTKSLISKKVGGKFSAYDGYIEGTNLELVPGKKIVQMWRGSDWPEGHYSKATFKFIELKNKTKLEFIQTGVPENEYESIKEGWIEFYWDKIKITLAHRQ